jgi:hypothetical protein
MDPGHRRHHLHDLRGRQHFLRTLTPDSDRYKLWLGDLVEFVNVAYGPDSAEMARLRDILVSRARLSPEATDADRERAYVERLVELSALLEDLDRAIPSDVAFHESGPS